MVFNSLVFYCFLPLVFAVYWAIPIEWLRGRNSFLLIASYVFYGWWDWRFLSLIAASSLVDFVAAQRIEKTQSEQARKTWLGVSLGFNMGMLAVFKYYNFFVGEFYRLFGLTDSGYSTLDIILPVGISFYTFQTLSYTIDVYRKEMKPTNNLIDFAAYVSFFPQLVAGPIERAKHLLPQFANVKTFNLDQARNGFRLIIWGLFKKVVIADTLAMLVNQLYADVGAYDGLSLVLGTIFFAFQIYCDFSGYSDIAIGCAKLLGFELMSNFRFPYFSRDIAEFWRRWHISLSTWFRDYLYIPLGGSRSTRLISIRNVFVIFLVSGLWHGANWTFIVWGGIHALLFLPLFVSGANRKHTTSVIGDSGFVLKEWLGLMMTFIGVCVGWVFFRSETIGHALSYFSALSWSASSAMLPYLIYPLVLVTLEWFIRRDERLSQARLGGYEVPVLGLFIFLVFLYSGEGADFIYFQF